MIRLALVVLVIASVAYLVVELLRAQEELGFTDPPSYLDDLDTDEGTPW